MSREAVALPLEDHAPAVTLEAPATIDPGAGAVLRADATDDRGVQRVVFMAGERVVCTDDAPPYECALQPGGADVGPTLLTAVALDTAEQGAFAQTRGHGREVPPGGPDARLPAWPRKRPAGAAPGGHPGPGVLGHGDDHRQAKGAGRRRSSGSG